jgi:hypothetical protein
MNSLDNIIKIIIIILLFVVFITCGTGMVYNLIVVAKELQEGQVLVGNIMSMVCFGVLFWIVGQNFTNRIWML